MWQKFWVIFNPLCTLRPFLIYRFQINLEDSFEIIIAFNFAKQFLVVLAIFIIARPPKSWCGLGFFCYYYWGANMQFNVTHCNPLSIGSPFRIIIIWTAFIKSKQSYQAYIPWSLFTTNLYCLSTGTGIIKHRKDWM